MSESDKILKERSSSQEKDRTQNIEPEFLWSLQRIVSLPVT